MEEIRRPHVVTAMLGASCAAFLAFAVYVAVGTDDRTVMHVFERVVYNGALLIPAFVCIARGLTRTAERGAWLAIGSAFLLWGLGNAYWSISLAELDETPFPSIADGFWIAFYVPAYLGLGLLVRARGSRLPAAIWLDGLIAAFVVAGVVLAVVFPRVVESSSGDFAAVATNVAYPIGDAGLLAFAVALLALGGLRTSRTWVLLGSGLALFGITDSAYAYMVAADTYYAGSIIDLGWIAGAILIGFAAWQPTSKGLRIQAEGWRVLVLPAVCALIAVVLETVDHFSRLNTVALVLVSAALVLVVIRLFLTFADHLQLLARSRHDSITDALTGLWNRRALVTDLERVVAARAPHVLAILDLDGFKTYNDTFGHPAGDVCLRRIGSKLAHIVNGHGRAYRLGGDEFCVLLAGDPPLEQALVERALAAMHEQGEEFTISASAGSVALPREADSWAAAMHLADQRLYERKRMRPLASRQIRIALLSALAERDAELDGHVHDVAQLAEAIGRVFELEQDELEELRAGAELHDIGKVAVPDSILFKPSPLDPEEVAFMRRHTLMGERIVSSVPALAQAARFIRSSHERWDGAGYPDGLAGEEIPLGSRIIAVCDAFTAMTVERPYRGAISVSEALRELESCAGTQFDPAVVAAFPEALASIGVRSPVSAAA